MLCGGTAEALSRWELLTFGGTELLEELGHCFLFWLLLALWLEARKVKQQ